MTLNKSQYAPGERINYCYRLTPQNVPYLARLYNGSTFLQEWNDNGANGGDCLSIPVNAEAQPGSRQLIIQAYVGGVKVAQAPANFIIVAPQPTEVLLGGATNLDGYCQSKYGEGGEAVSPGGNWGCNDLGSEITYPIDKNDACRWHYPGRNAYAKNVPNGFLCYAMQ